VNKLVGIVNGVAWLALSCAAKPALSSEPTVPANGPPVDTNDGPAARVAVLAEDGGNEARQVDAALPLRGCDGGILAKGDKLPVGQKPRLLFSAPMAYSEKAAALNVSGMALVKCIVERDGSLSGCRIVVGLPFLNEQILTSVQNWRYTPVMWCDQPVRFEMIIPVRVRPPNQ
jgi:protein TonB